MSNHTSQSNFEFLALLLAEVTRNGGLPLLHAVDDDTEHLVRVLLCKVALPVIHLSFSHPESSMSCTTGLDLLANLRHIEGKAFHLWVSCCIKFLLELSALFTLTNSLTNGDLI